MDRTINKYYPVHVWLLTNLLGTIIFFLVLSRDSMADMDIIALLKALPFAHYLLFFSLLFSLPALGLFWVVFLCIRRLNIGVKVKKSIATAAGLVFVALTFYAIDNDLFTKSTWSMLLQPEPYLVALILSTWIVHMYKEA